MDSRNQNFYDVSEPIFKGPRPGEESMKKAPHVIWVCPSSKSFYRTKGEVRSRPGSVIPRLAEQGIRLNVLIPHDPTLLPKTRLSSSRTTPHTIHLAQDYEIEITKLTRGSVSPGIYMVKTSPLEPALMSAVFSKAAIALATQLRKPVDIFHLFDWESALVPLFLELEKNNAKIFKDTRTFLNIRSFREQGNFAPAVLSFLGVPNNLFHPEGIEFFGKVSYLKAGLLFSDGVGLIDGVMPRSGPYKNGTGLEGVLDSLTYKLRRWASERSLRSHVDAYTELLNSPKSAPLLPRLVKRLDETRDAVQDAIEAWGPTPPERYAVNTISFMLQSPQKAFAFWEWSGDDGKNFGLVLEDRSAGTRKSLGRAFGSAGEFWIDIVPGNEYVVELSSIGPAGRSYPLLRSRPLISPRVSMSGNTEATFVHTKSQKRFAAKKNGVGNWENLNKAIQQSGGSSAWEWTPPEAAEILGVGGSTEIPSNLPSSLPSSPGFKGK